MIVQQRRWTYSLGEEFGHRDVTADVSSLVADAGVTTGLVSIQLVGSTGAVTTIEYEPGALADLHRALEQMAPTKEAYAHNDRWGDGNGFSHVRSALLKTSIGIPIVSGELQLGTWQQIVVLNLDNRRRTREVVGVVIGE